MTDLQPNRTSQFLSQFLNWLPPEATSEDVYRTNALFFGLSGLCLISGSSSDLERTVPAGDLIRWIHGNIVEEHSDTSGDTLGFTGGPCFQVQPEHFLMRALDGPHLTMTHLSIISILILAEGKCESDAFTIFKELWSKRAMIGNFLRACQKGDGSFCSALTSEDQADIRFVYSACCLCRCFDLWRYVDKVKMYNFIVSCFNYDGGFSFVPAAESHGASTYLALSSLKLAGLLDDFLNDSSTSSQPRLRKLLRWCVLRQIGSGGLAGRPNKEADSCYTFWVGGSLQILGRASMLNGKSCYQYIMSCVDPTAGGISKWPDYPPDLLHTFSSLAGLYVLSQLGQTDERLETVVPSGARGLLRSAFHFDWCCSQEVLNKMFRYRARADTDSQRG